MTVFLHPRLLPCERQHVCGLLCCQLGMCMRLMYYHMSVWRHLYCRIVLSYGAYQCMTFEAEGSRGKSFRQYYSHCRPSTETVRIPSGTAALHVLRRCVLRWWHRAASSTFCTASPEAHNIPWQSMWQLMIRCTIHVMIVISFRR